MSSTWSNQFSTLLGPFSLCFTALIRIQAFPLQLVSVATNNLLKPIDSAIATLYNGDSQTNHTTSRVASAPQKENQMNNLTERFTLSFNHETEERGMFNRVNRSGTMFGGSNEFVSQCMDMVENAADTESSVAKSLSACLCDGFDSLTVSLNVIPEDWHALGSDTVSSFRIIKSGYNPQGYEIAELDTVSRNRCYNFSHDDNAKLSKADTVKIMKKILHGYLETMKESNKAKIREALAK
jgi:hypothetical protein